MPNFLFKYLFLIFALQACVPMGMPELYSAENPSAAQSMSQVRLSSQGYRPAALVVLPQLDDVYSLESEPLKQSLGYQYLLGAIPFTRLFFQHGVENFLTEAALQSFIAQGFQTFITTEDNLSSVLPQLCPYASVRINADSFRVNAYDLFLTRKLSIQASASLQAWVLSGAGGILPKVYDLEIDSTSYKKYALAPSLSYATERAVVDVVDDLLTSEKVTRELQGAAVCRRTTLKRKERLSFIPLPVLPVESQALVDDFFKSYGFTSLASSSSSLKRSVQRGLESYFIAEKLPFFSSQALHPKLPLSSFNQLDSNVEKIKLIEDKLYLEMSLLFSERNKQTSASNVLVNKSCSVEMEMDYSLDGYLFFALEKAVKNVVTAVFTQKPVKGIDCR